MIYLTLTIQPRLQHAEAPPQTHRTERFTIFNHYLAGDIRSPTKSKQHMLPRTDPRQKLAKHDTILNLTVLQRQFNSKFHTNSEISAPLENDLDHGTVRPNKHSKFQMIFVLLVAWKFATRDELDLKCQMCRTIVRKLEANPDLEAEAVQGSKCAENPDDKVCFFIRDLVEQGKKVSNISRLCRNTLSCPLFLVGYEGMYCNECTMLASQVILHREEDRRRAFDQYCMTRNLKTLGFCGDIIDDGVTDFLEDLSELASAKSLCMSHGYCRIKRPEAGLG